MADQQEVFKWLFDITDAEAKARRLMELTQQLGTARAAGQDTTHLEQQINVELEGLGKLSKKKEDEVGAGEKLLKQKEKLAGVVGLLGGQFGETAGKAANLVEMLLAIGPAAAAAAAGVAGLTVAVGFYQKIQEQATKAAEAQERLNEAIRKSKQDDVAKVQDIGAALRAAGKYSPENLEAVRKLTARTMSIAGVTEEEASAAALEDVIAGGAVSAASMMRKRAWPRANANDPGARANQARGRRMRKNLPQTSPEDEVLTDAQIDKDLPEDMTLDKFTQGVSGARDARARLPRLREELAALKTKGPTAYGYREGAVEQYRDELAGLLNEIKKAQAEIEQWGVWVNEVDRQAALSQGAAQPVDDTPIPVTPGSGTPTPPSNPSPGQRLNKLRQQAANVTVHETHIHAEGAVLGAVGNYFGRPDERRSPGNTSARTGLAEPMA